MCLHDSKGAKCLLAGLAPLLPRLKKIWADAAYRGKELAQWCQQQGSGWDLKVVERQPGTRGFSIQPRRWVVESFFAWIGRNRRLAKDFEATTDSVRAFLCATSVILLVRRLARAS